LAYNALVEDSTEILHLARERGWAAGVGGAFLVLTKLSFQKLKSRRNTGAVRLAPITALLGTNSSRKTSIVQMLLLLKQTAESAFRTR
jgi:hypothetical protein